MKNPTTKFDNITPFIADLDYAAVSCACLNYAAEVIDYGLNKTGSS
jgi:hypothetical protein